MDRSYKPTINTPSYGKELEEFCLKGNLNFKANPKGIARVEGRTKMSVYDRLVEGMNIDFHEGTMRTAHNISTYTSIFNQIRSTCKELSGEDTIGKLDNLVVPKIYQQYFNMLGDARHELGSISLHKNKQSEMKLLMKILHECFQYYVDKPDIYMNYFKAESFSDQQIIDIQNDINAWMQHADGHNRFPSLNFMLKREFEDSILNDYGYRLSYSENVPIPTQKCLRELKQKFLSIHQPALYSAPAIMFDFYNTIFGINMPQRRLVMHYFDTVTDEPQRAQFLNLIGVQQLRHLKLSQAVKVINIMIADLKIRLKDSTYDPFANYTSTGEFTPTLVGNGGQIMTTHNSEIALSRIELNDVSQSVGMFICNAAEVKLNDMKFDFSSDVKSIFTKIFDSQT